MQIDLRDPTAVLIATSQALEHAGFQAAAFGGLALAMYGEPRETKDADLAVAGLKVAEAEAALRLEGFNLIRAFEDVQFGGLLLSRLTLFGGKGGSLNAVDLVQPRSSQYAKDVQSRVLTATLRDKAVRVVAPEDFIMLKLLATRERDLEDAKTVMRSLRAQLDINLIETTFKTLSREISDYDFMTRWLSVKAALSEN